VHSVDDHTDLSGIKEVSDPGDHHKTTVDLTGADGSTLNILATVKNKKTIVNNKLDDCKFREKELNRRLDDYK
jgi:hypothetical protein